jgi:Domain of unknown function (DUF6458)
VTVGSGIFLIVVGAIILFALNINVAGLEEGTLGLILIAAGIVVLVLALISAPFRYWGSRRRAATVDERYDRTY